MDEVILPSLCAGKVVLSDRFTDSSLVYQGYGRRLGADAVMALDRIACRGLVPEVTIFIDIDLETSLARARLRNQEKQAETRMDEQSLEFHRRVHGAYQELASREAHRFRHVDGRQDVDSIAARIWEIVEPHVL